MSSVEDDADESPTTDADPAPAPKDGDTDKSTSFPDWPKMMVRTEAEEWIPSQSVVQEKSEDEK